jgi:hypothetical protein
VNRQAFFVERRGIEWHSQKKPKQISRRLDVSILSCSELPRPLPSTGFPSRKDLKNVQRSTYLMENHADVDTMSRLLPQAMK